MKIYLLSIAMVFMPSLVFAQDFSVDFTGDCSVSNSDGQFVMLCNKNNYEQDPEPEITWTHCANQFGAGEPSDCSFTGVRRVRYGNGEQWVYKEFNSRMGSWNCKSSVFPPLGESWSGGPYRCEFESSEKRATVRAPANCEDRHDCNGIIDNIPSGVEAKTEPLRAPTAASVRKNADIGAFRNECRVSHFAYNDPLVYPGEFGASHLHMFLGHSEIDADTDPTKLRETGGSTCKGGNINRSAYWVPALLDMKNKKPLMPVQAVLYYKEGYNGLRGSDFKLPKGLGLIGRKYNWTCTIDNTQSKHQVIMDCPKGEVLAVEVSFPQCWDGENLWLADESHSAYPSGGKCPSTHPVPIPQITFNADWLMEYEGQSGNLMLSSDMNVPAGSSAHADWINGWDLDIAKIWLENCLKTHTDCHANLLGDGTQLY